MNLFHGRTTGTKRDQYQASSHAPNHQISTYGNNGNIWPRTDGEGLSASQQDTPTYSMTADLVDLIYRLCIILHNGKFG
jgi:hypothetical protein